MPSFLIDDDLSFEGTSCGTVLALLMCFLKLLLLDTDEPKLSEEEQSLFAPDWSDLCIEGVGSGEGQGVGKGLGISLIGDRHFP